MNVLNYGDVARRVRRKCRKPVSEACVRKKNERGGRPKVSVILLDWECRERFHSPAWLNAQDAPREDYELIWVELYDRVVPDVLERVDCLITCGQKGMYHKHAGYNEGLLHSRGDIITVCDSDAVFPPDFISSIIRSFEEPGKGSYKPVVLMHHEWRTSSRYPEGAMSIEDVKDAKWKWWPLNPNAGACMSVRRQDAITFGGFDEHYTYRGYLCGPYELGWRLVNAGLPEIWHDPAAAALWHFAHPDPVTVNGLKSSFKNLLENTYPHVDLHAIKAVEAFSTGRLLPLRENAGVFHLRMSGRVIGTDFEARYSDMTGQTGFSWGLLLWMRMSLLAGLAFKTVKLNILKPAAKIVLRKLLGEKIYLKLKNRFWVYGMAEIIENHYGYNVVRFNNGVYAIPQIIGPVDLCDRRQRTREEVLSGRTREEVIARIEKLGPAIPVLIESYEGYNVVNYRNLFYGIPVDMGHVNIADEAVQTDPRVIRTNTRQGVLFRIYLQTSSNDCAESVNF